MSLPAVHRRTFCVATLLGLVPHPALPPMGMQPMGISVQLETAGDGGMLRSTAKNFQLGLAATFQLQELASGPPGTPQAGQIQFAGMIQFAPGNPQAGQIGNCTENRCGAATLIITSVTAFGTTSYRLHNTSIRQVSLGSPVTAAFSFDGIDSKVRGPETASPVMSLDETPSAPPLPTFGVTVTAQAAKGKSQPLGVASVFQLQGIPDANNAPTLAAQTTGATTPAGPNAGATAPAAPAAGPPAVGTIQFALDGQQGPAINPCFLKHCSATIVIRNATPQGATVYTLRNVAFTQMIIGPMVAVAFTYSSVEWQTFAPGSKTPAQSGSWNYLAGTR